MNWYRYAIFKGEEVEFKHFSVMKAECIQALDIKPDGVYMDGTLGGAGHSAEIASKLDKGKLIMFDLDSDAISAAKSRLAGYNCQKYFIKDNFKNFYQHIEELWVKLDGVLLDLGVSSYQIDEPTRGFSYISDGKLNMAMDKDAEFTAFDVVNNYTQSQLEKIFFEYGEEKYSKQIASAIAKSRKIKPIETTKQLSDLIYNAVPPKYRYSSGHPAKKVFQAIRIEVNGELDGLKDVLIDIVRRGLNKGGRLAVLTFHSLEDRIVKETFNMLASDCICDKKIPICVCKHKAEVKQIVKKPLLPSDEEIKINSRSHSAKLRIVEKL